MEKTVKYLLLKCVKLLCKVTYLIYFNLSYL